MQMDEKLKCFLRNYQNLSEEDLEKLIILIIKNEKNKLGIQYPIIFNYDFTTSSQCNGNCSIEYNNEANCDEIHISINYEQLIWNYLNNRNEANTASNRSLEALYKIIETICHEMKHAHQLSKMYGKDITHNQALTWLKESIVIAHIDPRIYNSNHNNWSRENDSYSYQFESALDYIKQHCNLTTITQRQYESLIHLIESRKKNSIKASTQLYIEVNGQRIKLEEFINQQMSQIISTLPEETITSTILRYEYKKDGTKKRYTELMHDKKNMIDRINKNSPNYQQQVQIIKCIYASIIKHDINLQHQQLYEEARLDYRKYSTAIEELMQNKSNYSETEYNQRLTKLMQNRDKAQRKLSQYFYTQTQSDFLIPTTEPQRPGTKRK